MCDIHCDCHLRKKESLLNDAFSNLLNGWISRMRNSIIEEKFINWQHVLLAFLKREDTHIGKMSNLGK